MSFLKVFSGSILAVPLWRHIRGNHFAPFVIWILHVKNYKPTKFHTWPLKIHVAVTLFNVSFLSINCVLLMCEWKFKPKSWPDRSSAILVTQPKMIEHSQADLVQLDVVIIHIVKTRGNRVLDADFVPGFQVLSEYAQIANHSKKVFVLRLNFFT